MARVKNSNVIMKERRRLGFLGLPWTFTTYTMTDKKLVITEGFFRTEEDEILLYRIVDLGRSRTLWQKMIGVGTVTIHSSDKTLPKLELKNIKHSKEFMTFLSENVEKERERVRFRSAEIIGGGGHDHDYGHDHDHIHDGEDNFHNML